MKKTLFVVLVFVVLAASLAVPCLAAWQGQSAGTEIQNPDLTSSEIRESVYTVSLSDPSLLASSADGNFSVTFPPSYTYRYGYDLIRPRLVITDSAAYVAAFTVHDGSPNADLSPLAAYQFYTGGTNLGTRTFTGMQAVGSWYVPNDQVPPDLWFKFYLADVPTRYADVRQYIAVTFDAVVQNPRENPYDLGYTDGYNSGYGQGESDGIQASTDFPELIFTIVSAPFQAISNALNFDVLGFNLAGIVFFLITATLIVFVIRRFAK